MAGASAGGRLVAQLFNRFNGFAWVSRAVRNVLGRDVDALNFFCFFACYFLLKAQRSDSSMYSVRPNRMAFLTSCSVGNRSNVTNCNSQGPTEWPVLRSGDSMKSLKIICLLTAVSMLAVSQSVAVTTIGVQFQGRDGSGDVTGTPGCPPLFFDDVAGVVPP